MRVTSDSYCGNGILYVSVWTGLVDCLTPPQLAAKEAAIGREMLAMSGLHLPNFFPRPHILAARHIHNASNG